jgi:hypothetical protein
MGGEHLLLSHAENNGVHFYFISKKWYLKKELSHLARSILSGETCVETPALASTHCIPDRANQMQSRLFPISIRITIKPDRIATSHKISVANVVCSLIFTEDIVGMSLAHSPL